MMRQDYIQAEALGEGVRNTLGTPARVDENKRSLVREDQLRKTIVHLAPRFIARDRRQFIPRDLNGNIHGAAVSHIYDAN
ncbi:MAG: hypothetical protein ABIZ80_06350, partial [Bryobacteraceae bacterium]